MKEANATTVLNSDTVIRQHSFEISYLIIFVGFVIALLIESRAAIFGVGCSFSLIVAIKQQYKLTNYIRRFLFVLITFLSILSYGFKVDSSDGRLLIYKISKNIFIDNFPNGIGEGNFKKDYLQYQARYFATQNYSESELLLADNTYYAFNDYWEFFLERGALGGLFLLFFLAVIVILIKRANRYVSSNSHLIVLLATIALVTLSTAALFTHLIHNKIVQSALIFSISLLMVFALPVRLKLYLTLAALIINTSWLTLTIRNIEIQTKNELEWQKGRDLFFAGFKTQALALYGNLYPRMKFNHEFLSHYAVILISSQDFQKAEQILIEAIHIAPSSDLYRMLGDCHVKQGQFNKAEQIYIQAIHMVPNRFYTRYKLMNLYIQTNEFNKARAVAEVINRLPVKVDSEIVSKVRTEAKNLLMLKKINSFNIPNNLYEKTFYFN